MAVWESPIVPQTLSYCEQDKASDPPKKDCAAHNVSLVVVWKAGKFLDDHNGAVIAIFTIILAAFTVRLAIATDRLVEGSERIGKAQARAYLTITNASVLIFEAIPDVTMVPRFKFTVTNSGNSPAINFKWRIEGLYAPMPDGIKVRGEGTFPTVSGRDIPKDHPIPFEMPCKSLAMTAEEIQVFKHELLFLVVTIYVRFEDVFGEVIDGRFDFATLFSDGIAGKELALRPRSRDATDMMAALAGERLAEIGRAKAAETHRT